METLAYGYSSEILFPGAVGLQSDDDEEEDGGKKGKSEEQQINKYRQLLLDLDAKKEEKEKKDKEMEMEITFEPGKVTFNSSTFDC